MPFCLSLLIQSAWHFCQIFLHFYILITYIALIGRETDKKCFWINPERFLSTPFNSSFFYVLVQCSIKFSSYFVTRSYLLRQTFLKPICVSVWDQRAALLTVYSGKLCSHHTNHLEQPALMRRVILVSELKYLKEAKLLYTTEQSFREKQPLRICLAE